MADVIVVDERAKAAELRHQHVQRWAHARLVELADELGWLGIRSTVDWGGVSWGPCILIETRRGPEIVWCLPVAVRVEDGRPVYRWRYAWGQFRRSCSPYSYPATDAARAAVKIASFAERGMGS
ncbi:MAG: hypothetical protein GEV03_05185 [Streptosporangiales bacterium]|nr:hypothetical protein [Streptosporangiales bacterium]